MPVKKSWFQNKSGTVDGFKIATQRPCGLPTWKHERRSHSIKWKMLLLTSDTSPPTSCLWPSFMRGCKNVDWLQQAGSLYPSYHKIESRWKTQVHVVLDVSFFLVFSHDSYWNIFDLVFFFSMGMNGDGGGSLFGPMRRSSSRRRRQRIGTGLKAPRWIFQITHRLRIVLRWGSRMEAV